jgi:hypothetical protein
MPREVSAEEEPDNQAQPLGLGPIPAPDAASRTNSEHFLKHCFEHPQSAGAPWCHDHLDRTLAHAKAHVVAK